MKPTNERIKELRLRRGWSQAELAARAAEKGHDISPTRVSIIETGTRPGTEPELRAIASAFGMSYARLLDPKGGRGNGRPRKAPLEVVEVEQSMPGPFPLHDRKATSPMTLHESKIEELERKLAMANGAVAAHMERVDELINENSGLQAANAELNRDLSVFVELAERHGWSMVMDVTVERFIESRLAELESMKQANRYQRGHSDGERELLSRLVRALIGKDDPTMSPTQALEHVENLKNRLTWTNRRDAMLERLEVELETIRQNHEILSGRVTAIEEDRERDEINARERAEKA